jgi:hypothetical protein
LDLITTITGVSPEQRLIELIDEVIWKGTTEREWEGSAIQLERRLLASDFGSVVQSMLNFPSACGVFLHRLSLKQPDRVSSKISRGKKLWTIVREKSEPDLS